MRGQALRATALLLAATLAVGGCSQSSSGSKSPASTINATAPGLSPDQRIVREAAQNITPVEEDGDDFDWFTDNPEILLAGLGCVVGVAVGGSVGDCLAGAAVGGLAGAVSRVTIFNDREKYSSDEEFVEEVSKELDRVLEENQMLVPASERLAESHEAQIAELNKQFTAGTLTAAAYRQQLESYQMDEKALELLAEANNQLSTDIDRSLTGAKLTSDLQTRIQDQEGQFLADSGRIQYALERVSAALATVPKAVRDA
jgi:outer membrane lipoprotein SlyB